MTFPFTMSQAFIIFKSVERIHLPFSISKGSQAGKWLSDDKSKTESSSTSAPCCDNETACPQAEGHIDAPVELTSYGLRRASRGQQCSNRIFHVMHVNYSIAALPYNPQPSPSPYNSGTPPLNNSILHIYLLQEGTRRP